MTSYWRKAVDAAGNVTGRRFGFVAATSLLTTSVIVAAALTAGSDDGALAALLSSLGAAPAASSTTGDEAAAGAAGGPPSFTPAKAGAAAQRVTRTVASQARAVSAPVAPAPAVPAPAATPTAPAPAPPAPPPTPHAGRIKHVFLIALASPGYDETFGAQTQMPYLNSTLVPEGELLSGYSLLTEAGLPNYIAMISGQPPNALTRDNCPKFKEFPPNAKVDSRGRVEGDGCVYPNTTLTIADQLNSGGFTWHAYMEDMSDDSGPHNCVHPDAGAADHPPVGGYAARHNPFVYFRSLLDLGGCAVNDVPLSGFQSDLEKASTTPNYSFISPNLCHAGVAGQCSGGGPDAAASADDFLSKLVPTILDSPAYKKDGLLIITFGEASGDQKPAADGTDPKRVGTVLLSPYVTGGATDSTDYDPNSMLRTTEELFGLPALADASSQDTASFSGPLLGGD